MAASTQLGPKPQGHDAVPTYNNYIRTTLQKGESGLYSDQLQALGALKSYDDKQGDTILRGLSRLLQYGHLNLATLPLVLQALQADLSKAKDEKVLLPRIVHYLVSLMLGDGSAGTPLPVPPTAAQVVLAKAVDSLTPEGLAAAWADLTNERSPFARKQAALRALAAVTHASLSSRPDDATYVGGLFMTLTSLLDKLEGTRTNRKGLAHFIAQQQGNAKKNRVADFRQKAEMWGLTRCAFGAARAALSRAGILKMAPRSLSALATSDPVGARHALALASLLARDREGVRPFLEAIEPLLTRNVEEASRTGSLYLGIAPSSKARGAGAGAAPPAVPRDDAETHLTLRDTWARVYLARSCAAAIQSPYIAGDVGGRGAVFWTALLLTVADPVDKVSLEAIRALFGAPYPRAVTGQQLRQPTSTRVHAPTPQEVEAEASQSKVYGASWHMVMSQAEQPMPVTPEATAALLQGAPPPPLRPEDAAVFAALARRLLRCLQSRSAALVAAAARVAAVLAESRAWFHMLAGGSAVAYEMEPDSVRRWLRALAGLLQLLASDDSRTGVERAAALEALLWMQGLDGPPTLNAGLMLKAASLGGFTATPIVRYSFCDPWPDSLVSELLAAMVRRLRCPIGLPPELLLELAGGLAAGSPAGTPKEALQQLWEAAPGPLAVRAALQLLAAPLPPVTQPPAASAVEAKALACHHEAACHGLRAAAACWLGEHVNHIAGEYAWKSWEHKLGAKAGEEPSIAGLDGAASAADGGAPNVLPSAGSKALPAQRARSASAAAQAAGTASAAAAEKLGVAGVAHNPLLALVLSHLQRALLVSGNLLVRTAAAQALAKVAVRSGEPYRIQAYSVLGATCHMGVGCCDPLGLAPVVAPALELLDAMYAGELVLERHIAQHGARAKGWPAPALEALQRRHEWLLNSIAGSVCALPRDVYLPLGPRSRRLLYPDDKEEEEEAKAAAAAEAAAASHGTTDEWAAQQAAQAQAQQQPYGDDGGYGQAYDYDYGGYDEWGGQQQQQAAQQEQHDPLARFDFASAPHHAAVEVQWGGDSQAGGFYDNDAASDVSQDMRNGVVLYGFTAETEEEATVAVGERVRIAHDLGEWLQVVTPSGAQGLVPAAYVQVADEGGGALSTASSIGGRSMSMQRGFSVGGSNHPPPGLAPSASLTGAAAAAAAAYSYDHQYTQYDNPEYNTSYGAGYDSYYGGDYGASSAYGGAGGAGGSAFAYGGGGGGASGGEALPGKGKKGGFGGFDDFGAVLAAAKEAATQRALEPLPPPAAPALAVSDSGAISRSASAAGAAAGASSQYAPADVAAYTAQEAPAAFAYPDAAPGTAAAAAPVAPAPGAGVPGLVLYAFDAEADGELSVAAGEALVLGEEVDGWCSATTPDGRSGLVPVAYVQRGG